MTGRLENRIRRKARLKAVRLLIDLGKSWMPQHMRLPRLGVISDSQRQNPSGAWRRTGRSKKAIHFTDTALWACPLSLNRYATHQITDSAVTGLTGTIQSVDIEAFIAGGVKLQWTSGSWRM
ncbi:MAG: hypothetical protein ABSG14_03360 [Verrucomicrobiia bacterium]